MAVCVDVLLGIPDGLISSEDDLSNGWDTNKFGGSPNWLHDSVVEFPQCSLCSAVLPLVTQIYCPLERSPYHRVLYVFGCTNVPCWNKNESWKVLRCQSVVGNTSQEGKVNTNNAIEQETDVWCDKADEWGEQDDKKVPDDCEDVKKLEEQAKELKISEDFSVGIAFNGFNGHKACKWAPGVTKFVPYYITVVEESQLCSDMDTLSSYEMKLLAEYQKREGLSGLEELMDSSASCTQGWGGEKYEVSEAKHRDKIFQKFQKQLSLCPRQCLRYSWNGKPLLMSSQSLGKIPQCPNCGQGRVFEMQLMPALVSLLRKKGDIREKNLTSELSTEVGLKSEEIHVQSGIAKLDSQQFKASMSDSGDIEFATVFVYTCSQSCWSDDSLFREEYVVVHSDPDQNFFQSGK